MFDGDAPVSAANLAAALATGGFLPDSGQDGER